MNCPETNDFHHKQLSKYTFGLGLDGNNGYLNIISFDKSSNYNLGDQDFNEFGTRQK